MKTLTVCILGGSGFIGHHLAARLVGDGHRVRILTRRPERHRDLQVLPTARLIGADVHDPAVLERQFRGCDAVINLVGILNDAGDGKGFQRAHVELPRKVIDACRAAKVKRLLHMSALGADAAYGTSNYQRTKGEGENLVHAAAGLEVTSFRPSVVFGPGDSFLNRFAGLLRITPGVFPLACPDARFAPVYVGDVAHAYAHALTDPATIGQRYELCGPRQYTLRDLVQYSARLLRVKRYIWGLPDALSRLQAHVLGVMPGKPFTMDNYLSMQRPNVCEGAFPAVFGIEPHSLESIAPTYLGQVESGRSYDGLRQHARRSSPP